MRFELNFFFYKMGKRTFSVAFRPRYGRTRYNSSRRVRPRYMTANRYGYPGPGGSMQPLNINDAMNVSMPFSYTETDRKKKNSGGAGVTTQYDRKTVYAKKTMPRYKKRSWGAFVKKVKASLLKDVGTKTVVFNDALVQTITNNTQIWASCCLYGKNGAASTTTAAGHNDLLKIFDKDPDLSVGGANTAVAQFFSGVIDITMANNSFYTEGVATNDNLSLEVDVYELVFTKDGIDASRISQLIDDAQTVTPTIAGSGTEVALVQRGVTPWDLPDMLAKGTRILKKTKYMLSRGQVATYQYRDPKNYSVWSDVVWDNDANFAMKWKTRGFIILFRGVPTLTPAAVTKRLDVGVTRKYGYKILSKNTDADQYNP